MLEFESKRKNRKRIYSRFTLLILLLVFVFLVNSTYKIFSKYITVNRDLSATISSLEERETKQSELQKELERINSKVGKEEVLRENYSLAKEGEQVISIIDSSNTPLEIVEEKSFFDKAKDKTKNFLDGLFN